MSTLHLTRGLPASGKTTWARAFVAEDPATRARVNRDDLRLMMYGEPDYSWPQETAVTEASRSAVASLLAAGRDVVADDMNLRPRYVREWARFGAATGAVLEVVEFPITVEESIRRDATRARSVGEDVIRRMASTYLQKGSLLTIPEAVLQVVSAHRYEARPGTPPAVIVDIDGTLALLGDRSPYDCWLRLAPVAVFYRVLVSRTQRGRRAGVGG